MPSHFVYWWQPALVCKIPCNISQHRQCCAAASLQQMLAWLAKGGFSFAWIGVGDCAWCLWLRASQRLAASLVAKSV